MDFEKLKTQLLTQAESASDPDGILQASDAIQWLQALEMVMVIERESNRA